MAGAKSQRQEAIDPVEGALVATLGDGRASPQCEWDSDTLGTPASRPVSVDEALLQTRRSAADMSRPIDTTAELATLASLDRGVYEIVSELGQGGIGRVLRAVDRRLGREVALKELLVRDPASDQRFVREALVTARLQHPGIVPVYEAGRALDGEPFYAMKLVSGESLGTRLSAGESLDQRLRLVPQVLAAADAVAYAHSRGVIHRDLKPGNVMLGAFGEVVVIDWGLAKDMSESTSDPLATLIPKSNGRTSELTVFGTVLGTPSYMPPEQARGSVVDARADVYALGGILYTVLAGAPPYAGEHGGHVQKVLAGPPKPLASKEAGVPQDLLAIVDKAMAREPARRYADAGEFAADLRRFADGQLVLAHHYSIRQRLRRFVRRYRGLLILAAMTLGIAAYSLSAVLTARQVAEVERDVANQERDAAEAAREQAVAHADDLRLAEARANATAHPNAAVERLAELSPGFARWGEARVIAAEAAATGLATVLRGHTRGLNGLTFAPDGSMIATSSDDRTIRLWGRDGRALRVLEGHSDEAWGIRFSRDSRVLASGGKDGRLFLWDLAGDRRELGQHTGPIRLVRFGLGSSHLVTQDDNGVHLWDLATSRDRALRPPAKVLGVATLADGGEVLAVAVEGGLGVYDLRDQHWRVLATAVRLRGRPALTPDGSHVAIAFDDSGFAVWRTSEGIARSPTVRLASRVESLRFSPDGAELATGGEDGVVRLWDPAGPEPRGELPGHEGVVVSLLYRDDGRYLASASGDRTARLWDRSGGPSRVLRGFADVTRYLAFSPEGSSLVVTSYDGTARIFPIEREGDRALARTDSDLVEIRPVAGSRMVVRDTLGKLSLAQSSGQLEDLGPPSLRARGIAVAPDGATVAAADAKGAVHLLDVSGGAAVRTLAGHDGAVTHVCFADGGQRVVSGGVDGRVRAWDLPTGAGRALGQHTGEVTALACASMGGLVASGGRDAKVWLFDPEGDTPRALDGHVGEVLALAFTPDGRTVASGAIDHTIRVWPVAGATPRVIHVGGNSLSQIAFMPVGGRLIALQGSSALRLWDLTGGELVATLPGHNAPMLRIVFAFDGARAATIAQDGTMRLWDLPSGTSRILSQAADAIADVAFVSNGTQLLSVGHDGALRLWHDDLPSDPDHLRAWVTAAARPER